MPSFARVCEAVAEAWRERRDDVLEHAGRSSPRRSTSRCCGPTPRSELSPPSSSRDAYDNVARAVRAALRRLRRGAEVPAGDDARLPVPRATCATTSRADARDDHDHARRDGRGRHARPARRRLRPLLDRRLRGSCRTSRRCSTTTRCSRARTCTRSSSPASRGTARSSRRSIELRAARPPPPRRRLLLRRGRRLRGRSRASSTCWSLDEIREVCGDDADEVIALLRRHRRRELRRSAHAVLAATSCTSSTATSRAAGRGAARPRARCSTPAIAPRPARPRRQGAARLERAVPRRAHRGGRRARPRRLDAPRPATNGRFLLTRAARAPTAGSCARGARRTSRTPRTTPRCSRRCCTLAELDDVVVARPTPAPSPTTCSACSTTTTAAASSRPATTPSSSSCGRRTCSTTRRRRPTRSPPTGCCASPRSPATDATRSPRSRVLEHARPRR